MYFCQNDTVCLPPGLDCYQKMIKQSETSCLVPCKGIYADVTVGPAEELYTLSNFKHVLDKYKQYKAGFRKDQGKQNVLYVLTNNTSLAAPGALAHRLQRFTACNTFPPTLSKMTDGVRE